MQQLPLKIRSSEQQRFETYIASNNEIAVELLQCVSNGENTPWIFLSGPPGCGKTHLLLATCAVANEKDLPVQYFRLGNLDEQTSETLREFGGNKLLCLDDVDTIAGNFSAEHALFDLYNRCQAENATLIFSAKSVPTHMGLSLPDLVSRLSSCTLVTLKPLPDTARRLALRERALNRGIHLDETVIDYLFSHYQRDLGSLIRLVEKLDHFSLVEKKRITLPFLRKVLELEKE